MKVYCEDCKHHFPGYEGMSDYEGCSSPLNVSKKIEYDTYFSHNSEIVSQKPCEINKLNLCEWYEKK